MIRITIEKHSGSGEDRWDSKIELELRTTRTTLRRGAGAPKETVCRIKASSRSMSGLRKAEFDLPGDLEDGGLECCKEAIDHLQTRHGWKL